MGVSEVGSSAGSSIGSSDGVSLVLVGPAVGSVRLSPLENSHRPTPTTAIRRVTSSRHPQAMPMYSPVRFFCAGAGGRCGGTAGIP